MATIGALYDACVLYPAPLRDLLMCLATSGLVRAMWTNDIHDEWIGSLLKNRPDLTSEQLHRTRDLMNSYVPDALVTEYQGLIPGIRLPDPDDRHVLAAAIQGQADAVITFNLKDFPPDVLSGYNITALHPDDLVLRLLHKYPAAVCDAIKNHRLRLKRPPKTVGEYLSCLEQHGLESSVASLRNYDYLI